MERQKRKLKGIADLYNIEDERQKRKSLPAEDISQQNIFSKDTTEETTPKLHEEPVHVPLQNIFEETTSKTPVIPVAHPSQVITALNAEAKTPAPLEDIPSPNVVHQNILPENKLKEKADSTNIVKQNTSNQNTSTLIIWSAELVDVGRGYFPLYNDITDRMIREMMLDVYEQSVLMKMYRDSRGWKSDECEISHAEIVRSCNISKSQSQRTLAKLAAKGLIVNLGRSKSGPERNRFRVLPGLPIVPQKNISREDISREGADVPQENMVPRQDISHPNTNKNNNKDLVNTHTQPDGGVGSKFSLEECRRYAEHLQKTGQGITNPGGYATAIFRSGEFDTQIEAFLNLAAPPDSSRCPDCGGSGYFYPEGLDKGVKICKHENLRAQ